MMKVKVVDWVSHKMLHKHKPQGPPLNHSAGCYWITTAVVCGMLPAFIDAVSTIVAKRLDKFAEKLHIFDKPAQLAGVIRWYRNKRVFFTSTMLHFIWQKTVNITKGCCFAIFLANNRWMLWLYMLHACVGK